MTAIKNNYASFTRLSTLCSVLFLFACSSVNTDLSVNMPTSQVVDEANILTETEERNIVFLCNKLEKEIGSQLVVNTIETLNEKSIEDYSNKTFNDWKLGRKNINDGILIVVVHNDRKVRVEVGYGLENIITDVLAANIIQEDMIPKFKDGNFYDGIYKAVGRMIDSIRVHQEKIGSTPTWKKST